MFSGIYTLIKGYWALIESRFWELRFPVFGMRVQGLVPDQGF